LQHHIVPHAKYLTGRDNVIANWESSHHDTSDWQLLPSVFEAINSLLGPFTIYLFASRTNTQLPVYCSCSGESSGYLFHPLVIGLPYLCPPLSMIGRALTKICPEELEYSCLIALAWPAQVWYPQLLKMLLGNPVLLPMKQDLLLDPVSNPHLLIREGRMFLTAWPVFDFLTETQNCFYNHEEQNCLQLSLN